MSAPAAAGRADELIATLKLRPHPEGGHYGEVFRSAVAVALADGRQGRVALTTIDFVLTAGQYSAWHRVQSDEVWHLLEGSGLTLSLLSPDLLRFEHVELGRVGAGRTPRHVVPAGWWQAAEPQGDYAYVGATVGPGFDFADFAFGREDVGLRAALDRLQPELRRLL